MNSAAVIGRQLRQHQTTAARGGPLAPPSPPHKGRPRTPSHQPHPPPTPPAPNKAAAADANKPKGLDKMKSCVSCRCIWLCCKALSGGVLLIAIGVGMTVFGFYADHLAVQETFDDATNATTRVVDETIKAHLLNLTYVGPVFMGLGGMMIVAACVLFDGMDLHGPSSTEGTEQLLEPPPKESAAARCNGPAFLNLDLPPARARDKGGGVVIEEEEDDDDFEEVVTVAAVEPPPPAAAAAPVQVIRVPAPSALPPPVMVRQPRRKPSFLSPLFDVLPSPLDIQIADPDGCTPDALGASMEMRVFAPPPPRLRMEPHYLASVESDGLSDEDSDATATPARRGWCDADAPLLGRCSPPSSPEYPLEPLLKRERAGLRRFQLMRQVPRTLFDGPASEGGSR